MAELYYMVDSELKTICNSQTYSHFYMDNITLVVVYDIITFH